MGKSSLSEGCLYVCVLVCAPPPLPGFSAGVPAACGIQHGCVLGLPAAGVHWDPHSPPIAASLLQANVVCVVYDVTKEATIEKVLGPLLES